MMRTLSRSLAAAGVVLSATLLPLSPSARSSSSIMWNGAPAVRRVRASLSSFQVQSSVGRGTPFFWKSEVL